MDILANAEKKKSHVFHEEKLEELLKALREEMWNKEGPSKAEVLR